MRGANKCKNALIAAIEVINEACAGERGIFKAVDDGIILYIPESEKSELESEIGHKIGNPLTGEELERAVESCMRGRWAIKLAEKMLGPDAPKEAVEALKRKLCIGLLT